MLVSAEAAKLEAARVQKRLEDEELLREKVRKQREEMRARQKEEEEENRRVSAGPNHCHGFSLSCVPSGCVMCAEGGREGVWNAWWGRGYARGGRSATDDPADVDVGSRACRGYAESENHEGVH